LEGYQRPPARSVLAKRALAQAHRKLGHPFACFALQILLGKGRASDPQPVDPSCCC